MAKKTENKEAMTILEFCEGYSKCIDTVKPNYIADHLEIKQYLPILEKDILAQRMVDATMYKYDEEDGKRVRTNMIQVNSVAQRILFTRMIVETYTNLTTTSSSFAEEYDALKQSGVYDLLLVNYEDHPSMIPAWEIVECNDLVELKIRDTMTNSYEIHGFIQEQVERLGKLANIALDPIMKAIQNEIGNIPKEELGNIVDFVKKAKDGEYMEVKDDEK